MLNPESYIFILFYPQIERGRFVGVLPLRVHLPRAICVHAGTQEDFGREGRVCFRNSFLPFQEMGRCDIGNSNTSLPCAAEVMD